ncbi:hypothetical protein N7836_004250 [Vibrio vulnificus]|nr:hypothetical protein [Vibrio parahaemolyticus]EJV9314150.1 hypothetical protein [Vibrio vulnificus]HCH6293808.1 hypothetical protein [Vibrio parahaemolyticus]
MARFRVETILDTNTGLIYAECYYPEDAAEPIASTSPIYQSHEQAEKDVIDMFKNAFS